MSCSSAGKVLGIRTTSVMILCTRNILDFKELEGRRYPTIVSVDNYNLNRRKPGRPRGSRGRTSSERILTLTCTHCGKVFKRDINQHWAKNPYCSCECFRDQFRKQE